MKLNVRLRRWWKWFDGHSRYWTRMEREVLVASIMLESEVPLRLLLHQRVRIERLMRLKQP